MAMARTPGTWSLRMMPAVLESRAMTGYVAPRCREKALTQVVGEVGIDGESAAENAVALGVRVTDRVLVFLEGPAALFPWSTLTILAMSSSSSGLGHSKSGR